MKTKKQIIFLSCCLDCLGLQATTASKRGISQLGHLLLRDVKTVCQIYNSQTGRCANSHTSAKHENTRRICHQCILNLPQHQQRCLVVKVTHKRWGDLANGSKLCFSAYKNKTELILYVGAQYRVKTHFTHLRHCLVANLTHKRWGDLANGREVWFFIIHKRQNNYIVFWSTKSFRNLFIHVQHYLLPILQY